MTVKSKEFLTFGGQNEITSNMQKRWAMTQTTTMMTMLIMVTTTNSSSSNSNFDDDDDNNNNNKILFDNSVLVN